MKPQASTVKNVNGITSAAENTAPKAIVSALVPEKYRWCMVPTTPPSEYRMTSSMMIEIAIF